MVMLEEVELVDLLVIVVTVSGDGGGDSDGYRCEGIRVLEV